MNMTQRKYLRKERLDPLLAKVMTACYEASYAFTKYVCWGEFVQMIRDGRLTIDPTHYHKNLSTNLLTSYNNPFGLEGTKLLARGRQGVTSNDERHKELETEWKRKFQNATDFIMLAEEETVLALLHNLEASALEFIKVANASRKKAGADERAYVAWLQKQGVKHDY